MDNPALVAPFAYRVITPLLARLLIDISGVSAEQAYYAIAFVSAVLQLWLVYVLAQHFRAGLTNSLLIMGIIALVFYHVKYLLFDIYRPDHLAYPLMTLAFLTLLKDQRGWCLALAVVSGDADARVFDLARAAGTAGKSARFLGDATTA